MMLSPKDCNWIFGDEFHMIESVHDNFKDCGRAIDGVERFSWNNFLDVFLSPWLVYSSTMNKENELLY